MRKFLILSVVFLSLFLPYGCKKGPIRGGCNFKQTSFISVYYIDPIFEAKYSGGTYYNEPKNPGIAVSIHSNRDNPKGKVYYFSYDRREYNKYAIRYNDLYFEGCFGVPNANQTIVEPIEKIICYEIASNGKRIDVSDKVMYEGKTYLPFIESGYNKKINPYRGAYQGSPVYKPLNEVTTKDLTLLVVEFESFRLTEIPPYNMKKKMEIELLFSKGGKNNLSVLMPRGE